MIISMSLLVLLLCRISLIHGNGLFKLELKFLHFQIWVHVATFKTCCLPVCGRTLQK